MLRPRTDGKTIWIGNKFYFTLQRTLRIPDDDKTYPLPPGLGCFPIFHVLDYKDKLPEDWAKHAGVFIPMYQREALWICFNNSHDGKPHAVKVAVGKINAVSGKPWNQSLKKEVEDYLVCPPQPWLDGINAGNGFIRQFVAMPLGMGYTVEAQVSGEERWGGIQLIAYAPKPDKFKKKKRDIFFEEDEAGKLLQICCEMGEMATMGIAAGGRMKQDLYPDPHGMETWDEGNYGRVFIHILNSEMFKEVTGHEPPPSPISAKAYKEAGLPWFDLYNEGLGDIAPSEELKKVKSISEIDKEKGETNIANGSFEIPHDHIIDLRRTTLRTIEGE